MIISPMYPKNSLLTISIIEPRLNEAVELKYTLDAGFSQNETGRAQESLDLSCLVARAGRFSNHFIGDLKLLAELST